MWRRSPNLSSFLANERWNDFLNQKYVSMYQQPHDHHTTVRVKKRHFTPDCATPQRLNPLCQPNPEHHVKKEESPSHALEMVWNIPPFLPRHVTRKMLHPLAWRDRHCFFQIPRHWHTWRRCDRSIILCAGTSTTCSATHPVPRSCGTTSKTPRLVHQPETHGHQKFAHRCAAICAPAARTGSNPTFHSEPEIRAHAQFGKRYSLACALVESATPDCAHTHQTLCEEHDEIVHGRRFH